MHTDTGTKATPEWLVRHRERTDLARLVVEMYDQLPPALRGRLTFRINGFIHPRPVSDWSPEEPDPGLYATILTTEQLRQITDEFALKMSARREDAR
jgi:hypothetical protein